jgi:hypothetical protein
MLHRPKAVEGESNYWEASYNEWMHCPCQPGRLGEQGSHPGMAGSNRADMLCGLVRAHCDSAALR